uniref:C2H2-type domain-containing protein n=1 Tax=Strigamia maritima TaxID=126957 RepID=T1J0G4_STRMM
MAQVSSLLISFKTKIEEAVSLVPNMPADEKLKAVQFWNVVSEKLQEIVNNSAADISALALEQLEKENVAKMEMMGATLEKTSDGATLHSNTSNPSEKLTVVSNEATNLTQQQLLTETGIKLTENDLHDAMLYRSVTLQHQLLKPVQKTNELDTSVTLLATAASIPSTPATSLSILAPSITSESGPLSNTLISSAAASCLPDAQSQSTSVLAASLTVPTVTSNDTTAAIVTELPAACPLPSELPVLPCVQSPNESVPKLATSAKRGRGRPPRLTSGAKCDKNGDSDWSPAEERQARANRRGTNDNMRQSVRRVRKNFTLTGAKSGKRNKTERLKRNRKRRRGEATDSFAADGAEYTCEFCKRKFPNISSLTTHRWIHTKPYACTECSARFSTKGNLIVHKRRHTGEKPYNCNQCDARFSTKGNLKRHVKTHSGEKPWECSQCGGRFTEKKSLKVHMRRHTGEKPYQCKVCGKRFAQTGILQTHMAMHMDQKAHLCDHCGKSFRQKSQLRLHMMRHEGVRKYQCPTCPARFLTKGDLERHNRIHTGERPFICELCGKTFTRQQSLNEHMNRHYGLKPYECKYCGRNFAEMSACYKHIKQHERSQIPTMQHQHQVTVDSADGQKFTVLVHTDQPLDVGSEISVVQQEQNTVIPTDSHITVAVTDQIGEFAAMNLLASASSYQQNY